MQRSFMLSAGPSGKN